MVTEPLNLDQIRGILVALVPELRAKRKRLKGVSDHLKMANKTFAPKGQTQEHRYLDALTHTPWGAKVAVTYAQELSVSGYLSPTSAPGDNDPAWAAWVKARMPIMQDILIREAMQYGESFCAALPADSGGALAKPLPPMHTVAKFRDPVTDVWPEAVLVTTADRKTLRPVEGTLYAGEHVYNLSFPNGLEAETAVAVGVWTHKLPLTPVIRFFDEIDSLGNTTGKIEPLLPLLERIRKDTYDRVLIQHKSSWKVRTISGLEADPDATSADIQQEKMRLAVEDILVASDPQARFGTLDETPLDNLIKAKESDVYELASTAQIPPSALMPGNVSNVSAEAIAELRNSFENRIADHKEVLGDSFAWLTRALAAQAGITSGPDADSARTAWDDRSVRSLAQAVDAWGKGAAMLGIPPELLWGRLPGITQGEVQQWVNYQKRKGGLATAQAIFERTPEPVAPDEAEG